MLGSASVLRPFNDLEHRWTFQFFLIFGCILPQLVSRSNGLFERWLDGYSQQGQYYIGCLDLGLKIMSITVSVVRMANRLHGADNCI